jgi:protoporphyrinogen oxidase
MKIVILGAGPTGLGAAYRLSEIGTQDWMLFEGKPYVGGLSASFYDQAGFTWDIGGHVLFSHYPYFDKAVRESLAENYLEHQRECWVRIQGRWVPYPFQNNIRYLPQPSLDKCLEGLRRLEGDPRESRNFKEWMQRVFGAGIVEYFMEPYNWKVWGVPADKMSWEWIGERISVIDRQRIERNIREKRDDVSWGPNNTFKFPLQGGTGAIFDGIAKPFASRIALRQNLVMLDLERREVRFSSGRKESFSKLVSTIPLDQLVTFCPQAPPKVCEAAETLAHNSCLIVGFGFRGHREDSRCWMYFPESNAPFYRVTNLHNYSPLNVAQDGSEYYSLMCETTYSSFKEVDKTKIIEDTFEGLLNVGLIDQADTENVTSTYVMDIPYSYPIPTIRRDEALKEIQGFFEYHSVYSRGRFGAWKYEVGNMDHSFMQGVEVVDRILSGSAEKTVNGDV